MSRYSTRKANKSNQSTARLLNQKRVACIDYTNARGHRSIRRILPLSVTFGDSYYFKDMQYLLRAYDIAEGKDRTFAMSNIHRWWSEYKTPADVPTDTREISPETRAAFKAAWFINADGVSHSEAYLAAREQRDWEAFLETQGRSIGG